MEAGVDAGWFALLLVVLLLQLSFMTAFVNFANSLFLRGVLRDVPHD